MNNPSKSSPESPAKEQPGEQKLGQGWIPVSERLPEPLSGKFLVTNNIEARDAQGHMSHIWLVRMIHDGGDEYGWFAFDDYDRRVPEFVTHWQPLPPPPERT